MDRVLNRQNPQAHDDDHTNKHRAGQNFINHSYSQTKMCLGAWELTLHTNKTDPDCDLEYFIPSDPTASGCTGTYSASSTLPSVLAAKCDDATCTSLQTSVTNLGKIPFLIFLFRSILLAPPSWKVWEWIRNHANLSLGLTHAHLPNVENWDL